MEYKKEEKKVEKVKLKKVQKKKVLFKSENLKILKNEKEGKKFLYKHEIDIINSDFIINFLNDKIYPINRKVLKTIHFRICFTLLKLYIIIFLNSAILCEFNKRSFLLKSSEVILKTKGTGPIKILSDSFFKRFNRCQIYINNDNQSEVKNEYNFSYFDESINVIKIIWDISINSGNLMFSKCNKIIEIDLSKFDPSNIKEMNYMFSECSSLTSIKFSYFNSSLVNMMCCTFLNCSSLISLDLSNFDATKVTLIPNIFSNCKNLEYINFKYVKFKRAFDTSNAFLSTPEKLIVCFEKEDNTFTNILKEKKHIYCNNKNSFQEIINICYSRVSTFDNKYICDICGNNYIFKNNTPNDNNSYINCFEEIEGYYLDEIDLNYKPCFISCKLCKINGNNDTNNCLECREDYIYEINISNSIYKNCYINNPFQIIKSDIYSDIYESTINLIHFENKTKIILNAINELINDININDINRGEDKKTIIENKQIILTSTTNQKNNEDINNITMDLGQCENILKNNYNISYNNSLYILQIISEEKGMKIPKMEYEIYYPLNNENELKKLNLTYCKDIKIDISISVKIDEQLDKYNSSSDYYNNICYKTTSESGTDISLNDRRNEFVNNNITLCEENCELIDYDYIREKAKCSCDIKTSISSYDDIKFNKNDFFKSFTDIKNIFNIEILKCYNTILNLEELKKNYGFYIVSFVVIFYFITLLIFVFKSYEDFKKEIKNIIFALKFNEFPLKNKQRIRKPKIINKKMKIYNKKQAYIQKKDKVTFKRFENNNIKSNSKAILLNLDNNISRKLAKNKKGKAFKNSISPEKILNRKEFELNSLDYKEALKIDHRNFCQYYYHSLKYNHPISFSFASYDDYNIQIIKKFLFFFSFCSDFIINALFFTDETIHKIYQDKGKFNFLYQIPQTLYSTLIGKFIDTLIKNLALSQDIIIDLKEEKIKNLESKHRKIIRIFNIKFILFFILSFIVLLFFWYYIVCFCGIYINSQSHLIKDSVISLITSLFIPFVLNLIPGIFRVSSLNSRNTSHKYLYKFSIFLENYLS